jgi:hypothetical protein
MTAGKRKGESVVLLVLNSVTSTPQWIRELEPRDVEVAVLRSCSRAGSG